MSDLPISVNSSAMGVTDAITMRARVERLEAALKAGPTKEPKLRHLFAPGVYGREITLDAGDTLTSKIHLYADLNIVSKGRISFTTDEGVKTVDAPYAFVSPAGAKRAGHAHTEVVWTTIHPNPTEERDLEKLEALFIAPTQAAFLAHQALLEEKK